MNAYSLNLELKGLAFPEALDRTRKALAAKGFGIPVEMDTQALFKQKLGKASPNRVILGACLASVAFEALNQEPDIAVLLPCNVVVREIKEGCEVSTISPKALFSMVKNVDPALADIVEAKLKLVLQELGETS
jgi:uncharacterized protein (DUF302 family)